MDKKFEITGTTKLTCLLGNPVSHSISPAMHNASFQKLGLDYTYLAFSVDETHFERAVDGLITLGAAGWNCTMPLKRLMYERVDTLYDSALLSGAVNTVVNRDGQLFGDNTPAPPPRHSCGDCWNRPRRIFPVWRGRSSRWKTISSATPSMWPVC